VYAPLYWSQYFVGVTLSGDRLAHIRRVAVAVADHAAGSVGFPWPVENAVSPMQLQLHHPHHPHHSHHHHRRRRRRQPGNLTKLLCCSQTRSLNGFIITTRSSKEFPKRAFFSASSSHGLHISVYIYIPPVSVCWSNANCSNNWPIMPQNTTEWDGDRKREQDGESAVGRLISSATPTPAPLRPLSHSRRKRRKPFNTVLSYLKVGIRCAYTKPNMVMKWPKGAEGRG